MKTQKGNVAVIALIIIVVAITTGVVTWLVATRMQAPVVQPVAQTQPAVKPTTSTTQPAAQSATPAPVPTGIIYENKEFGFQLTLPKSWVNYTVEKQVLSNEESLSGKPGEVMLVFNYLFDNPIPRVEGEKSMGTLDKDWLWEMRIIPIANWKADLCGDKSLCVQGKVLAKNDQYVFEDIGHANIGAGQLCNEQSQKLLIFCSAMNDFDESKISFQLTN